MTNTTRFSSRMHRQALPLGAAALSAVVMFSGCAPADEPKAVETEEVQEAPAAETPEAPEAPADPAATYGARGALAAESFSEEEMLLFAVQDEYLALAEYTLTINTFGVDKPYTNIKASEETHLELLRGLYATRGLEFPADTSADIVTQNPDLLAAAQHGVTAEIDNIAMYDKFLATELPADIASVFTQLRDASKGHLRAFETQVNQLS